MLTLLQKAAPFTDAQIHAFTRGGVGVMGFCGVDGGATLDGSADA